MNGENAHHKLRLIKFAQFQKLFARVVLIFPDAARCSSLHPCHSYWERNEYVGNCANVPWRCNEANSAAKSRIAEEVARFSWQSWPKCRMVIELALPIYLFCFIMWRTVLWAPTKFRRNWINIAINVRPCSQDGGCLSRPNADDWARIAGGRRVFPIECGRMPLAANYSK